MSADKETIAAEAEALRRIYALEKARNPQLTQEKIAAMCGWKSQGNVQKYLSGALEVSVESAAKLAKALSCKIADFSPRIALEASEILSLSGDCAEANNHNAESGEAIFNGLPPKDVEEFKMLIEQRRERYRQQSALSPKAAQIVEAISSLDDEALTLLDGTIQALAALQAQKKAQQAA